MAVSKERLRHAVETLERLPARSRSAVVDLIEQLAAEEDADLLTDGAAVAADLEAVARVQRGDYSDTVSLEVVEARLKRKPTGRRDRA